MVGSYQDNTSAAFTLLLGKNATAFEEWGTRPSKPRFQAFGDAKLTFMAYDAAIQGGVFQQHDPHTLTGAELERVVVGYGWGARFRYRSLELQYREWYIGRTFQNGLRHGWGTVTLAGWF